MRSGKRRRHAASTSVQAAGGIEPEPRRAALKGWRITWDDAERHFRVACPHDGRFVYAWPVALEYRWRWRDHFTRLNDGHKQECPA